MRLLVTGATGFIGRTLVLRALADDNIEEIVTPVRSPEKLRAQLAREGVEDTAKLRIVPSEAPQWDLRGIGPVDRVVHCAGVLFGRTREEYFRVNTDGTSNLLAQLTGSPRVVVLSSQSAGGPTPAGHHAKKLDHPDRPISWYGESKLRMEQAVREAGHRDVFFLRAPMVLGPGDQATLPLFRMVRGKLWTKPGRQLKHFSWISSDDLADAIDAWFARGAGDLPVAHVTSPGTITDADLMLTAAKVSGCRGKLLAVPQFLLKPVAFASKFIPAIGEKVPSLTPDRAREIWPNRWVIDPDPFHQATGWRGRSSLEDTLSRTLAWFRREGLV
ncbi:MAG: NAD(P)-dependent oxidoreductase [Chthoniobacterales bacterium]